MPKGVYKRRPRKKVVKRIKKVKPVKVAEPEKGPVSIVDEAVQI